MVVITEEVSCPFCGREIDGKIPDYEKKYTCPCGAVYWPEAIEDIAEGQAVFSSENSGEWEFFVIRNFDFITDDEETEPTELDEWVLVFTKRKEEKTDE